MKTMHTPEPWTAARRGAAVEIHAENDMVGIFQGTLLDADEANARRIVAAINACEGISTELLEGASLLARHVKGRERLSAYTARVEAQRDQLLAALEFYADKQRYMGPNQRIDSQDKYGEYPSNTVYLWDVLKDNGDIARAAIAAVKGGVA